jgi:hypothetical protein
MNDNIGNLLVVSIGLVACEPVPVFFFETIFGIRATPAERIAPFSLDPSVPVQPASSS